MASNPMEATNRLLKVIIAILIRERKRPLRQKIETLDSLGLRPFEIADILGKTGTHINKELSGLRKQMKRRR
jgi:DNA-directed RNA polymerase specialized sigma24 family protein